MPTRDADIVGEHGPGGGCHSSRGLPRRRHSVVVVEGGVCGSASRRAATGGAGAGAGRIGVHLGFRLTAAEKRGREEGFQVYLMS